jgi:acetyl-CoA synthetase
MTRGILNDQDRFIETYWSKYHDIWDHGDLAFVDSDGLWYIQGRTDDIIKISGHRIGPAEVESAITSHPAIAEAVVIGIPDKIKGQAIAIYATLKTRQPSVDTINNDILKNEIIKTVEDTIGKFARPKQIKFVADLPKTRTGKLVRRLIRAKVSGTIEDQDITMIENPASLDDF